VVATRAVDHGRERGTTPRRILRQGRGIVGLTPHEPGWTGLSGIRTAGILKTAKQSEISNPYAAAYK